MGGQNLPHDMMNSNKGNYGCAQDQSRLYCELTRSKGQLRNAQHAPGWDLAWVTDLGFGEDPVSVAEQ